LFSDSLFKKKKTVLIHFFFLKGRGTVATGRIEQGVIKVGEEVEILGLREVRVHKYCVCTAKLVFSGGLLQLSIFFSITARFDFQGGVPLKSTVTGVEMFKKILDNGQVKPISKDYKDKFWACKILIKPWLLLC